MSATAFAPTEAASTRRQDAFTARLEKRLLVAMARRLPARCTPDQLTALGLVAQILAGISYAVARRLPIALLAVNVFLTLNWAGDSLDGTLARVREQQRPRYGFYVDHVCDLLGATALCLGLGASGYVHWAVAVALLFAFLALAAESFLATVSFGVFEMAQFGVGPTELRLLLGLGNSVLLFHPYATLWGRHWLLYDVGGVIAVAAMLVTGGWTVARRVRALHRAGR